jgi:hypothetical protein
MIASSGPWGWLRRFRAARRIALSNFALPCRAASEVFLRPSTGSVAVRSGDRFCSSGTRPAGPRPS